MSLWAGEQSDSHRRIWLIGGTTESAKLARAIASAGLPYTVTVTTESARSLYPLAPETRIWVGRLNASQLEPFCTEQQIAAILDASHPYAVEISKLALTAAVERQIPYLRFERPAVNIHDDTSHVISLDSFETLLSGDYLQQQRVLLTVGYKALHLFQNYSTCSTLFARILPSLTSLEAAIAAGFSSERIIALRPPVSAELEKALWRQWNISFVVTKASGVSGGEKVKRAVAAELGIPLVVIARPAMEYPLQTSDVSVALEFCRSHLSLTLG